MRNVIGVFNALMLFVANSFNIFPAVLTISELNFSVTNLKRCDTDGCDLPASTIWTSVSSGELWHTCVDCQEDDYGGWPPGKETPAMSAEHIEVIASKCSNQECPSMPQPRAKQVSKSVKAKQSSLESDSPKINTDALSCEDSTSTTAHITPLRHDLNEPAVKTSKSQKSKNDGCSTSGITPSPVPLPKKPSATALAMHRKWQEAAEGMGGKDARIVVSKPAAKKLVFDLLHEAFAPMNITDIYQVSMSCSQSLVHPNYSHFTSC